MLDLSNPLTVSADPADRARLNEEIILSARRALPEAMRRQPRDKPLDPDRVADLALQIGLAMANRLMEEGLI